MDNHTALDIAAKRIDAHSLYDDEFIASLCEKVKSIKSFEYNKDTKSITIETSVIEFGLNRGQEFEKILKESLPEEYSPYIIEGSFFSILQLDNMFYIVLL